MLAKRHITRIEWYGVNDMNGNSQHLLCLNGLCVFKSHEECFQLSGVLAQI